MWTQSRHTNSVENGQYDVELQASGKWAAKFTPSVGRAQPIRKVDEYGRESDFTNPCEAIMACECHRHGLDQDEAPMGMARAS